MTRPQPTGDVFLAGSQLSQYRHICAFFHSAEEEYETLLPFIKEGLDRGEKSFHVIDAGLLADYQKRLAEIGVDVEAATASGQLEVRPWEEAYLRGASFDQDAMLSLIEEILQNARTNGFPLTRLVAHMEWSVTGQPGCEDLVEYETRLNQILPRYDDPVICTYDLARFKADVVMDILRTHPLVIIGGLLQHNPFFVPPEELLHELRQRRVGAAGPVLAPTGA
jgi:hypothetical protein